MAVSLIQQQYYLYKSIRQSLENFQNAQSSYKTLGAALRRIELLNNHWSKFESNHKELLLFASFDSTVRCQRYFSGYLFSLCEDAYFENKSGFTKFCDTCESTDSGDQVEEHASDRAEPIPLSRISIPQFSGKCSDWPLFRDSFSSMVICNPDFSPADKLYYLNKSLDKDVRDLITWVPDADDNFEGAWETLTSHFEPNRAMANSQFDVLYALKSVQLNDAKGLEVFRGSVAGVFESLNSLTDGQNQWDFFLACLVGQCFDENTFAAWQIELGDRPNPPSYSELDSFLVRRIRALETANATRPSPCPKTVEQASCSSAPIPAVPVHPTSRLPPCLCCFDRHHLWQCPLYKALHPLHRKYFAREKKLCFNCLGKHIFIDCFSAKRCSVCGKKHHTTLHDDTSDTLVMTASVPASSGATAGAPSSSHSASTGASTSDAVVPSGKDLSALLPTAMITVVSSTGSSTYACAILDQTSQFSFVTESMVQTLRLPRRHSNVTLTGSDQTTCRTRGAVTLTFRGVTDPTVKYDIEVHVVHKLPEKMSFTFYPKNCPMFEGLCLADPAFNSPGGANVLLGANIYSHLLRNEKRKDDNLALVAQLTTLGWIIYGKKSLSQTIRVSSQGIVLAFEDDLCERLQEFWSQEMVPPFREERSEDEEYREQLFISPKPPKEKKLRLTMSLKRIFGPPNLEEARAIAYRTFKSMQRPFRDDPTFRRLYSAFYEKYLELGLTLHLQHPSEGVSLPHDGVINESHPAPRGRVERTARVNLKGSQKTTAGLSINDFLPKVQTVLIDIFLGWRLWPYVFACDVENSLHQNKVNKQEKKNQSIFCARESEIQPDAYRHELTTWSSGSPRATDLATRVQHQLAENVRTYYPLAAEVIQKDMYGSYVLSGEYSIRTAGKKVHQLDQMYLAGGFTLKNWVSNAGKVLQRIHKQRCTKTEKVFEDLHLKALEINWCPLSDEFNFYFNLDEEIANATRASKRSVTHVVTRLFDPMGWLAPTVVLAKIFLENLNKSNLGLDETLPDDLASQWKVLLKEISEPVACSMQRWLGTNESGEMEIHGFTGASERAFSAAVYVRSTDPASLNSTNLLVAKTKTIRRNIFGTGAEFKLAATVLLTKLIKRVRQSPGFENSSAHLWTDSGIVLTWVRGNPSDWTQNIKEKVAFIQENVPDAVWHHLAGSENPADLASQGLYPRQLQTENCWWKGPSWLRENKITEESWTNSFPNVVVTSEKRSPPADSTPSEPFMWGLAQRGLKLDHIIRITAMVMHVALIFQCLGEAYPSRLLCSSQLARALDFWIRKTQWTHFSEEMILLMTGRKSKCLAPLAPFLDGSGVIRVGKRLRNSLLDGDAEDLAILPRDSDLTPLVIDRAHRRCRHGETRLTLSTLRQEFWVIGARDLVRKFINRCVICKRNRRALPIQPIGNLCALRATEIRPFLHSRVDFVGPFELRIPDRSAATQKSYIIIFMCNKTSAVHLELAFGYDANAFITAFKNFTGWRGSCQTLTNDFGPDMRADSGLNRMFSPGSGQLAEIIRLLYHQNTTWVSNQTPFMYSFFGKKCDDGVKSLKHHLKRVVGHATLTSMQLFHILDQIEYCVNSRPLCAINNDLYETNALTPNHFLTEKELDVLSAEPIMAADLRLKYVQLRKNWQVVEHFWEGWLREYLHRFQWRSKWLSPKSKIRLRSLVLMTGESPMPAHWPLARVVMRHPASDGLIRKVTLRTTDEVHIRSVSKLCLLPISKQS